LAIPRLRQPSRGLLIRLLRGSVVMFLLTFAMTRFIFLVITTSEVRNLPRPAVTCARQETLDKFLTQNPL
jgi:hypothetical protein